MACIPAVRSSDHSGSNGNRCSSQWFERNSLLTIGPNGSWSCMSLVLKPEKGLGRRPALHGAHLEHPLGEFQKRAVRAADHGAAFSAPLVLKAADNLIGIVARPFPAEAIERITRGHRRVVGIGEAGDRPCTALVNLRLAPEHRFARFAAVRFIDGEFDFCEALSFPNALIIDRESREIGVRVDFINGDVDDVAAEVLPALIGVLRNFQPSAHLIDRRDRRSYFRGSRRPLKSRRASPRTCCAASSPRAR